MKCWNVWSLIIHLKNYSILIGWEQCSWSLTPVQITTKIFEVKTKTRRLPEANQCISKTAKDRVKPSKDHLNNSDFWRFPKNARTLPKVPKITRKFLKISEVHPNTSEDFQDLRQSPENSEDHRIFSKLFQVLEDRGQFLLCTLEVNVWSEALSSLFFSSVLLISNHMIFPMQFRINKQL